MSKKNKIYIKRIISDISEIASDYDPKIHIWYDENNFLWLKAAFDKQGYWEYRLISYK